tara:strand:- start:120 stop:1784 length:1665 start_codon:yes stop_codon:yes gene_type:complete
MTPQKRVTFIYRNYEGLGIGYIAAYLRSLGHKVQLLLYPDPWSDTYVQQKNGLTPMAGRLQARVEQTLLRGAVDFDPDLICFSVVTDDYQWCLQMARVMKQATRGVTLFGGVHVTSVPERVVANPAVDLVGLGEGERMVASLLEQLDDWKNGQDIAIPGVWYQRNDECHKHGWGEAVQDLDDLPFPAKDLFYAHLPALSRTYHLATTRGCPYRCTYCYNAVMIDLYKDQGKWMRQRSVDNVLEELHHAVSRFHPHNILFTDDVFATRRVWVDEFAERYKSEIGLPFALITEAVVLSKEPIVAVLSEAGLINVQLGVQTLNEGSRKAIARPESATHVENAFTLLNKYGIHYQVDHMFGIPGETIEDQRTAAEFYNEYRPDIVSVFWLKYYPKLPIIDLAIENGILREEDIDEIEEGRNEVSYLFGGNSPEFHRFLGYNLLFGWLNFLPRSVVRYLLRKGRLDWFASESFFLSSSLPRLLSTVFRRPDFRGRDHIRRTLSQARYILKLVLRDRRETRDRTESITLTVGSRSGPARMEGSAEPSDGTAEALHMTDVR